MSLLQPLLDHLPGFLVDVLRLCGWLVLLTVIFLPLERWFAVRKAAPQRHDLFADLAYYFINSLLPAFALALPLAFLAGAARYLLPAALPAFMAELPLVAKMLLAFVIGEIGYYWGHRLSHELPWLWRFHAVHHSAEHMYFLVNTRAHPVDMVVTRLFSMAPLYAIGLAGATAAGSVTPALLVVLGTLWGFFIHSNFRVRIPGFEWIISTPLFHHWHHTRVDHINRNYASMLPLVDRLFGTLHLPSAWPADYGIEAATPKTLRGQLLDPIFPGAATENRSQA
ncbi:sterol desaturase family protein [Herbaspirillum lusitanum]|uniref:Sterol desaturase family protein n=1 Tax=Herbaspirillum lusitanum TaxID=213312 RepID=A0ABW9A5J6_9BURK